MKTENMKILESSFSDGFKYVMQNESIYTVTDLLNLNKDQLMSIPNFTFQMLVEYQAFLEENNLDIK